MPWNCLCASKEKRKLEISAPILNIEDSSNLQLVPSLKSRPFVLPAGRQQQPQKPKTSSTTKPTGVVGGSSNSHKNILSPKNDRNLNCKSSKGNKNSSDVDGKKLKKTKRNGSVDGNCNVKFATIKKSRKQKRELTTTENNKNIIEGNDERSSSKKDNDEIARQLPNVTFSFENSSGETHKSPFGNVTDGRLSPRVGQNGVELENIHQVRANTPGRFPNVCDTSNNHDIATNTVECKINENVNSVDNNSLRIPSVSVTLAEQRNDNMGNYDEIPSLLPNNAEGHNANMQQDLITTQAINVPTEEMHMVNSIPYIDDEHNDLELLLAAHQPPNLQESELSNSVLDDHNSRFITLHPQNVGSFQTIIAAKNRNRQNTSLNSSSTTINNPLLSTMNSNNTRSRSSSRTRDEQTEHNENQRNTNTIVNRIINNNDEISENESLKLTTKVLIPTINIHQHQKSEEEKHVHQDFQQIPVEHDFHSWKMFKGKLCQLCHESLLNKPSCAVKCRCCELVCHSWCASSMVSGFCI